MTHGIERFGGEAFGAAKSTMPLAPALRAGDFVFVSGQVPLLEDGSILQGGVEAQTRLVMDKIAKLLTEAGASWAQVAKATVYLADARDFVAFNRIYADYFPPGERPARTTVQCTMMLDFKVEIDVIAYAPRGAA
jgi:reactive intermediate/imine deaminase